MDEDCRKHDCKIWGNGRNWKFATPREGGWIRIWPLAIDISRNDASDSNNSGYVKTMVNKVIKILKFRVVINTTRN